MYFANQIEAATSNKLTVTADMLGKYIQVVAKGDNNSAAEAKTITAVADADSNQIAIVSAKQTGAKTVDLEFVGNVTSADKLTVAPEPEKETETE